MKQGFVILDFGSQYTWLIARSFRELGFEARVCKWNEDVKTLKKINPSGLILSGGPSSVLDLKSPKRDIKELENLAPLLAICYGMQLVAFKKGGVLNSSVSRTYGRNKIHWKHPLIPNLKTPTGLDESWGFH